MAPQVARALWDEITEIERDPIGRGSLYADEEDAEFAGLRHDLAVAGYAIFYLSYPEGVYVTSIRPWDYPDFARPLS